VESQTARETFLNDEMMRVMSLGHWSRTELVRSFVRRSAGDEVFPTVYEVRFYCAGPPDARAPREPVEEAEASTARR
jgi:hypothetical protein